MQGRTLFMQSDHPRYYFESAEGVIFMRSFVLETVSRDQTGAVY